MMLKTMLATSLVVCTNLLSAGHKSSAPPVFGFVVGSTIDQVSNILVRHGIASDFNSSEFRSGSQDEPILSFDLRMVKPDNQFDAMHGVLYKEIGAVPVRTANGTTANVLGAVEKNTMNPTRVTLIIRKGKLAAVKLTVGETSAGIDVWQLIAKIGKQTVSSDKFIRVFLIEKELEIAVQEKTRGFSVNNYACDVSTFEIYFYSKWLCTPEDFFAPKTIAEGLNRSAWIIDK